MLFNHSKKTEDSDLTTLGSTELVEVFGIKNIPAKVDTGADSSAIWASSIDMKPDGTLSFFLFDEESPFYTGEKIETTNYQAKSVRSSHGDSQIRYRVKLPIVLAGKSFTTSFTLADRSKNNFPILIGRRTLKGSFIVNVSKSTLSRKNDKRSTSLNEELKEDPYKFHRKYMK